MIPIRGLRAHYAPPETLALFVPVPKKRVRLPWPPEHRERLAAMWLAGKPQSEIAGHFGASDNSIKGMVARMGLPRRKPGGNRCG